MKQIEKLIESKMLYLKENIKIENNTNFLPNWSSWIFWKIKLEFFWWTETKNVESRRENANDKKQDRRIRIFFENLPKQNPFDFTESFGRQPEVNEISRESFSKHQKKTRLFLIKHQQKLF